MRPALRCAAPASPPQYERRRPEQTPLYRLVQQHLETFAAEVAGLPQFVKDEFDAYLAECVIPRVPVRQWLLSFPIPLRSLFAVHPELLEPVLRIIHRAINTFLIKQAHLKRKEATTGAITLIQRFGSATNLNIHLHGLVLDEVRGRVLPIAPATAPPPPHDLVCYPRVSGFASS